MLHKLRKILRGVLIALGEMVIYFIRYLFVNFETKNELQI